MNMALMQHTPATAERLIGKQTTDYRDQVIANHFAVAALHEKNSIIAPAIQHAFERATAGHSESSVVLDYGMGPGYITVPFLADGNKVFGYDTADDMITIAKNVIDANNLSETPHFFTSDYDVLNRKIHTAEHLGGADFGILSFVHPSIDTQENLKHLMQKVSDLMAHGSTVILIGANPEGLARKHVTCEYDVDEPPALPDGHVYTGRIYDNRGNSTFEVRDRFWSQKTLIDTASLAGFRFITSETIKDHRGMSPRRPDQSVNPIDPFIMLTFKRQAFTFGK